MEWMEGRKEKKWPASTVPEKEVATFFLQRAASAQLTIIGGNNNQKTQEEAFSSSQQVETGIPFGIYFFSPVSFSLCFSFLPPLLIWIIYYCYHHHYCYRGSRRRCRRCRRRRRDHRIVVGRFQADPFIYLFIAAFTRGMRADSERIPSGFGAVSERFRSGLQLTWPLMCLKRWEETQRHSKMRRKHPADSRAISEQFPSSFRAVSEQVGNITRKASTWFDFIRSAKRLNRWPPERFIFFPFSFGNIYLFIHLTDFVAGLFYSISFFLDCLFFFSFSFFFFSCSFPSFIRLFLVENCQPDSVSIQRAVSTQFRM